MTAQTRSALKTTWAANYRPTSAAFTDIFDSFTTYNAGLEALGVSITSGATGVPNFSSSLSASFFVPTAVGLALTTVATTAAAQALLGGGTVGIALFTASTTAAAQNILGGGTVGKQLFACSTTAEAAAIVAASAAAASPVPVGTIMPYAGSSAPTGWLFANGAAVSRATYADLFTAISTSYGVGDGVSTFNVPDLRGRGVFGHDSMGSTSAARITTAGSGINGNTLGATGGTETHTLTTAQLPAHAHGIGTQLMVAPGSNAGGLCGSFGTTSVGTQNAGGGGAHQNMPPGMILNFIIKHSAT